MIKIGVVGLGRMGKIHLENLSKNIQDAKVIAAVNPGDEGQNFALQNGIKNVSNKIDSITSNPEIDAVVICSPNNTHSEYIIKAAKAGKAVFCEKPIDMSLEKANETISLISKLNVPIMIGFNQRFDNNFSKVKNDISAGKIGLLRNIHIISRDPQPPPISYIKNSGGLFKDMTIHDFDMARFIMGSEVAEVFAYGNCLIDPAIGKAGDIDSATVLLKFENNALATIENSREAKYGYDQRLEVFGSKGVIKVKNPLKSNVETSTEIGTETDSHLNFFMDRYKLSYLEEMRCFINALINNKPMPVSGEDGIKAMIIAEAANKSLIENRPIKVDSIKIN
ncbi:inositol 2-dehydrogenase [Jejuia spongiicola]|uniref:Inositol 2-dehydrogenase n=1 Tax=Jejuia spongiicola TaxID=2942207 RepID=A0ABT0QEG4_9FLAO|nr:MULTISPECIES: inositol 2-dehydrogenase [Flavobacteriaceae]MCL6295356.1 inositol 2-dehydrogenase [Jejuia spongiicola]PIA81650.1 inositol 2-dehydrogenase [Gaetbulibacter sp. 4G1]